MYPEWSSIDLEDLITRKGDFSLGTLLTLCARLLLAKETYLQFVMMMLSIPRDDKFQ